MKWREEIAIAFGPGLLAGITWADWMRLLRANSFAVNPRYWIRALVISLGSVMNSYVARREQRIFGAEVAQSIVQPPLFVLGHWRSGTTHLHNLLSKDDRFAFPNYFQASFPRTFLSTEDRAGYKLLRMFMPRQRPMDAMSLDLDVPWEDEYSTCIDSSVSPYTGAIFARRREYYERYLTFRGVPDAEIACWRASLMRLLKKLTFKYGRPLILKSPPHTCRIRLLLEMFPGAKFVHIHRNPFDVFRSTQHMMKVMLKFYELQRFPRDRVDEWIIRRYRLMHDVFFEERPMIPNGCFHDVAFEDLEADPLSTMQIIYERLNLPDFKYAEPSIQRYVASLSGYRKNTPLKIPGELRARIIEEWQGSFSEWGYPQN